MYQPEILVVDDVIDSAKEFSEYLEEKCHVSAVAVSTLNDAISCVKKYPIKIVVLDQTMPIKGTEVFKQLLDVNPYLKSIMFTGEADFNDTQMAHGLKYDSILWKSQINQLPETVFRLYAKYCRDFEREQTKNVGKALKKRWILKPKTISYFIVDMLCINENHVFDNMWKTVRRIEKGEEITETVKHTLNESIVISTTSIEELKASFALKDRALNILQTELLSELRKTISVTSSYSQQGEIEKIVKFSISPDEKNVAGSPVVSKCYEYTRGFREYKIHIRKECSCCNKNTIVLLQVHVPRDTFFYRSKTYYEDESVGIIDTGDYHF